MDCWPFQPDIEVFGTAVPAQFVDVVMAGMPVVLFHICGPAMDVLLAVVDDRVDIGCPVFIIAFGL